MPKRIKIVSVSTKLNQKETLIGNSVEKYLNQYPDIMEFEFVKSNTNSLASVYNKYLNQQHKDYILIFMHDDVYLADNDFIEKCYEAIKSYDIFGVAGGAGGLNIEKNKPALWHLISNKRVGFAGHFAEEKIDLIKPYKTTCWVTNFGESPSKANLIDGVFLGINVEKVLQKNIMFDEACPAKFHFYDLLFCVRAKKEKLSLGVFPFYIFHASHGLKNYNQEFIEGDKYFKKYCLELNDKKS